MDSGGNGIRDLERALKSNPGEDPTAYLIALERSGISLSDKFDEELVNTQLYFKRLILSYAKLKLPLGFPESCFGIPYSPEEEQNQEVQELRRSHGWESIGRVEEKKSLAIFNEADPHRVGHPSKKQLVALELIPQGSINNLDAGLYSFCLDTFDGVHHMGGHRHFHGPNITTAHECLENYIRYRTDIISAIERMNYCQTKYLENQESATHSTP